MLCAPVLSLPASLGDITFYDAADALFLFMPQALCVVTRCHLAPGSPLQPLEEANYAQLYCKVLRAKGMLVIHCRSI